MARSHVAIEVALVPVVLFVAYFTLDLDNAFGVVLGAALVVMAAPLVVRRIARVRRSDRPGFEAVQALALFGSVWIVGFSTLYYSLAARDADQFSGLETQLDGVYFTVTVLSTVGFGDIGATGQAARAIVASNMILNLVAIGVAVKGFAWAARQRLEETKRLPGVAAPPPDAP